MSAHTAGPWRMDGGGDRHTSIAAQEKSCVADVWWINLPEEEAIANARLIAAAPDMLNELQEILEWAVTERAPLRDQEINSIRALIAKATGSAS